MRKTSIYHYSEGDVRKIIKEELKKAKSEWLDEFIKKVAKFKDEVIISLDKVMGELKAIREEQVIITGRTSQHTDTLENHEARITKLEQASQAV